MKIKPYQHRVINRIDTTILYIGLVVVFSSISSLAICFDKILPTEYSLLPLLPLAFGLISCIFMNVYRHLFNSWSVTLIVGLYFLRSVIIPLVMCFGEYNSLVKNSFVYNNMDKAIILLVYEILIVFLTLSIKVRKLVTIYRYKKESNLVVFNYKSTLFNVILLALIVFVMVSLIFYPRLKFHINFFVNNSSDGSFSKAIDLANMRQGVPSVIYWLYTYFFSILQLIIPILLIQFVYKRNGLKSENKAILLSLIIVFFSIMIMTQDKAKSIFVGINLIIMIYFLYFNKLKKIYPLFLGVLLIVAFIGLILKSGVNNNDNIFMVFSLILVAYFGGPPNVAVALSMNDLFDLQLIISDIFNSIPFIGYFFQNRDTTQKVFNLTLYGNSISADQIVPMIGQGYFYFGFILAPIFSALCIIIAVNLEKRSKINNDIFNKYIYMYGVTIFSIAPNLYNFNILITSVSYWLIILLISRLSKIKMR